METLFSYSIKGNTPTHHIKKNTKYKYIDEIGTFSLLDGVISFNTDSGEIQQIPSDFRSQCRSTGHPVEINE